MTVKTEIVKIDESKEIKAFQAILNEGSQNQLTPAEKKKMGRLLAEGKIRRPQFGSVTGGIAKFGEGASFGWTPKLYGALQSALPYPYGSGQSYEESVGDYRRKLEGYAKENPKTALGLEIAGGVTSGGGIAGGAKQLFPKAASWMGMQHAIPKYGAIGAGSGAVAGAGYSDVGEEGKGAASGALWGLAIGAGGVPVLKVGGKVIEVSKDALSWISGTMSSPKKKALDELIQALKDDGVSPEDVGSILETLGEDAIIGDVGDFNMLNLVDQMSMYSGNAQHLIRKFLGERQERQGGRISELVKKYLKQDQITLDDYKALGQARKKQSAPFYQEAYKIKSKYQMARIHRDEIDDIILSLPDEAFVLAEKLAKSKRLLFNRIRNINTKGENKVVDYGIEELDYLKRGLDDAISQARNAGQKEVAASYVALKRRLLNVTDEISPDYKKARNIFSGFSKAEEAADYGRKILNPSSDWDVIEDFYKNASQTEKDYFKMGAVRAIRDKIGQSVDTASKEKLFNKESIRQRIKKLFDDEGELDDFMKDIAAEGRKSQTRSVTGGSQTHPRELRTRQFESGRNIKDIFTDSLLKDQAKREKINNELAKMLLSTDPNEIEATRKLLEKAGRESLFKGATSQGLFAPTAAITAPNLQQGLF